MEVPVSAKKKLTLSVDEDVIEKARRYSDAHGTSISRLVTTYLDQLDAPSDEPRSPWVERLSGILPSDVSVEDYRRRLQRKYE